MVMWLSSWSCHWVEETWWNCTRLKCWNPKNINDYSGIALVDMSWHAWLLDGVSPESFELQWPASTAMISLLKLNRSCPGKQEMENHEESNKFRHEPRESTPERSSPAFGLGFQALKTSRIRDTSSKPSTPGGAEAPGRHGCLQGSLVVPNASMASRSTQRTLAGQIRADPSQQTQAWVCCEGSARIWPPRRNGPAYFLQVCAWWLPGCSGASASNRIFRSSNRNLSVTFRKPPFCTTSGMADTNLVPRFSLWAHSVSSSTLYSCSSGTGQRDVNLACIAHGAFTFYNVLSISLGLRIVVDVFCIVISMCCIVLYICAYVYILCITLFAMHIICIYMYIYTCITYMYILIHILHTMYYISYILYIR